MAELRADNLLIDIPGRTNGSPLSFSIQPGDVWGVLGPNGAGKSTLLHTLAGLRKPRAGQVTLNQTALNQLRRKHVAQHLAVVFQERQDGFPGTVLETAMIGRHPFLAPWDVETAEDLQLAEQALAELELTALQHRLVSTLSGGERQRLAIATALCQTPKILLADEPSNHLDLHHQVSVMNLIQQRAKQGCGVLLCLHDLNLAARYCNKLLLLFPNGEACWGDAATMLIPEVLERLYQQTLVSVEAEGQRFFLPVNRNQS
jgi:iron complex transport system ATP-binding protein